jgi:hypothetical protein
LNDDVDIINMKEIFKKYWKIIAHLNFIAANWTSIIYYDSSSWLFYAWRETIHNLITSEIN